MRVFHGPRWVVLVFLVFLGGCAVTGGSSPEADRSTGRDHPVPAPTSSEGSLEIRLTFTEGLAYEALENYSRALDLYRTVIERTGGDPPLGSQSRLRMARIFRDNLSNPDRAVEVYREYLEAYKPDETSSYRNVQFELGQLYQQQEQWEEATATYRQLLELSPDASLREQSYYNLGEVHISRGNYDEAVRIFQTLLEKFPEGNLRDGALYRIAEARLEQGDDRAALDAYLKLLENHPDSDLREYVLFRTVQLADKIGDRDLVRNWARVYMQEYEDGQYRDDVQALTPGSAGSTSS